MAMTDFDAADVARVRARDGLQDEERVLDPTGHRPELVQGPAECHRTGARDTAKSRTQAGHAAAHGGCDDAAAGFGADGERDERGGGESALYAGDLTLWRGSVTELTNLSGTFQFDDEDGLRAVAKQMRHQGLVVAAGVVGAIALKVGILSTYQVNRFAAFANPALDPRGVGYNTGQARIAIGQEVEPRTHLV